jgi:hypothetical protein
MSSGPEWWSDRVRMLEHQRAMDHMELEGLRREARVGEIQSAWMKGEIARLRAGRETGGDAK